jgi:SAM-dependent methyltransferase
LSYRQLAGSEQLRIVDTYPQLEDRTASTEIDAHYFYQGIWTGKLIARDHAGGHVDIGSDHRTVGMLTCLTRVTHIDIRPLPVNVDGLSSVSATILQLPYGDGTVRSLSCLHVAEHVGLGRYGDPLDPLGTRKAAQELARVLSPGGNLYFSVPVGRPRVEFNAHRVHTPMQVIDLFPDLELVEFSAVDDSGAFLNPADEHELASATYACGLFWFRKPDAAVSPPC